MKQYKFRFVARQGEAGVVEVNRNGVIDRCILPMEIIVDAHGVLSEAEINAGMPYGLPFAEFLDQQTEVALHRVGVFALEDLYIRPNAVVGALNPLGEIKLTDVIKLAENYQREDHTITAEKPAPKKKSKGD